MKKMAGMATSGMNNKGVSIPKPSPVPSVASTGAVASNEAGTDAKRAAFLRIDITGAARRDTEAVCKAGRTEMKGPALTKAAETIFEGDRFRVRNYLERWGREKSDKNL